MDPRGDSFLLSTRTAMSQRDSYPTKEDIKHIEEIPSEKDSGSPLPGEHAYVYPTRQEPTTRMGRFMYVSQAHTHYISLTLLQERLQRACYSCGTVYHSVSKPLFKVQVRGGFSSLSNAIELGHREVFREYAAEFLGTLVLMIFGLGNNCQVTLSGSTAVVSSPKGVSVIYSLAAICLNLCLGVYLNHVGMGSM